MFRNSHLDRGPRTLELGNGAVLSALSSLLPQNSLLTGKITGKMHENCFDVALKPPYLLGKADLNCKFNREFNKQEQGMLT
jgi:hypothetical protein